MGHLALGAHEEFAERVPAIFRVAAVRAEDEVDVALAINHERGLAVIVEFARIDLVRRFAHGAHASLDGSDPLGRGVDVGGDIRVFVRPLIGDIRDTLIVFAHRMLEATDRIPVTVVGKVRDVGGGADATDGQGAEQSEEPAERGDRVDHEKRELEIEGRAQGKLPRIVDAIRERRPAGLTPTACRLPLSCTLRTLNWNFARIRSPKRRVR